MRDSSERGDRDRNAEDRSKAAPSPVTDIPTRRKNSALADKSNLAGQRDRGSSPAQVAVTTRAPAAATRLAPKPAEPTIPNGASSRASSTLHVYRDSGSNSILPADSAFRRPSLPLTDLPAHRPRPPRRLVARQASEPLAGTSSRTHGSAATAQTLPRSPISTQNTLSGAVRSVRTQQFLFPPTHSADALPSTRPAPWALSTPAFPVLCDSSSPIAAVANGLPAFHFTTTEFGDLPSLQLESEVGGTGVTRGKLTLRVDGEAGGEGMDSTVVLETWDESASGQPESPRHSPSSAIGTSNPMEEQDDKTTIRTPCVDEIGERTGNADDEQTVRAEPPAGEGRGDDLGGERTKTGGDLSATGDTTFSASTRAEAEAGVEETVNGQGELDEAGAEQSRASTNGQNVAGAPAKPTSRASTPSREELRPHTRRKSTGPIHYTSSFLPPRHPRWPSDEPLPDGPPSSEDELAYYLRTTGTFSSEDDLPASDEAPGDESAKEDWLAEREVGRAIKASSRQREKRLTAYDQARSTAARLRLGDGAGGRRKEWKREILPLEQVRLPRLMREAIEAKALELGQELAGLDVEVASGRTEAGPSRRSNGE